jgi:cyclase
MLTKRIIPCLDIKNGRCVKGVNFVNLKDAGDPVELARTYSEQGADELVFLDISATIEERQTLIDLIPEIAKEINIPFTIGGGVNNISIAKALLNNGADKIAVNSAAVKRPELLKELSDVFGNQCVVLAVDARNENPKENPLNWEVYTAGGTKATGMNLFDWAIKAEELGAGEILFTSMNHDGTKQGFALHALEELRKRVNIPIIASGGAGNKQDFMHLFEGNYADAGLAASIFHFGEIPIPELKSYLKNQKISIRL